MSFFLFRSAEYFQLKHASLAHNIGKLNNKRKSRREQYVANFVWILPPFPLITQPRALFFYVFVCIFLGAAFLVAAQRMLYPEK